MKSKYKEKDLQKDILDYLRLMGYLAVKFPSVGIYNKKTGSYIPMPQRGVSDILFWGKGKFGAIECKALGAKATDEQKAFLEEMRSKGGIDILAYDLDTVIKVLN
jgi:hypothetical protein